MRILLLNQTFYPDHAATAQHAYDLACDLVRAGHQVQVIASRSIYGSRGRALPRRETVDGIEIYRVGISFFGKASILLRMIDFAVFYLAATGKALIVARPDIIIPFTTPPMIVWVGLFIAKLKRCACVYWLMDIYPDVPVALGVIRSRGMVSRVLERLHRFAMRRVDRVVVLGRCMRDRVLAKDIPADRVTLIRPWADIEQITPVAREDNVLRKTWGIASDQLLVMYSGNFGLAHDTQTILDAMKLLRNETTIRFIFIGGGKGLDRLREAVTTEGLTTTTVRFEPYQPREQLAQSLSAGDVHLISQVESMTGLVVPCKVFGIMAAGRPAVFVGSPDAEVARLLEEHDAGRQVRPGDAAGLIEIIRELAEQRESCEAMGQRARQAIAEHYDRRHATAAWQTLLCEVSTPPTNGAGP